VRSISPASSERELTLELIKIARKLEVRLLFFFLSGNFFLCRGAQEEVHNVINIGQSDTL
jgi:hypothetical protein